MRGSWLGGSAPRHLQGEVGIGRLRGALATAVFMLALLAPAPPAAALIHLFQSSFTGSGGVYAFTIGANGAPSFVAGSPFGAGGPGVGVAVRHQSTPFSSSPAMVFQTRFSTNQVSAFTVVSGGALTAVPGSPFAAGGGPISAALAPNGRFLYVANHTSHSISAYSIATNGALAAVPGSPFATNGQSPWGLSVSPDGVLYAPQENSGSVAAMRIESNGTLTHLAGSPFVVGSGVDQFTSSAVSIDGRFLFVTAGLGPMQGLWSFGLNPDGRLSSIVPISRQPSPIPVGVRVAPNNRHVYVVNKSNTPNQFAPQGGAGGVSGYAIGSNGSLTRILGASPPLATGGTMPVALDMLDRAPSFMYVAHELSNVLGSFTVNDSSGAVTELSSAGLAMGDAHFGTATTVTNCSVVFRGGGVLQFSKRPGSAVGMRVAASGNLRIFQVTSPRCVTPVRGSGCMPIASTQLHCFTTNVGEVRVVLFDGNNAVATDNGLPETVFCSGSDSLTLDLRDTKSGTCNSTTAAVRVGRPVRVVGRSARIRGGVAALTLFCPRNRQGGSCNGRLEIRRAGRVIGRATYAIRAGRRAIYRVPLAAAIRGRTRARLVARERDRRGRPMTTDTAVTLRSG